MPKPVPTLADDLLFSTNPWLLDPATFDLTKQALRRARQFVFDDEAATRLGEIMRDYPEFVADHSQFVRLPFDPCWIEYPARVMRKAILGKLDLDRDEEERQFGELSDKVTGFLYAGNRIYTAATTGETLGQFSPIVYRLHEPLTFDQELAFADQIGTSRGQIDYLFWGTSFHELDEARRRALRTSHGVELKINPLFTEKDRKFSEFMTMSASDLRNAITLLLLINRPNNFTVVRERDKYRGLANAKQFRTFMAHTVVTIKLAADPVVRNTGPAMIREHSRHRRHEVRGHFAHNAAGRSSACVHNWIEYEPNRWECTKCIGRRWWKRDHMRGDASLGFVTKHYAVERGERRALPSYGRPAPILAPVPATRHGATRDGILADRAHSVSNDSGF